MAARAWQDGQDYYTAWMGKREVVTKFDAYGSTMTLLENGSRKKKHSEGLRLVAASSTARPPHSCSLPSPLCTLWLVSALIQIFVTPSTAVFINFHNCLSPDLIGSNPKQLQFQPLFVWATFNSSAASHNINVTAYGNVAGIATQQPYPGIDDPQWSNPNDTIGKIPDVSGPSEKPLYTTFTTQFNVLDYTPYNPPAVRFCNTSSLTQCPLAPVFHFKGNQ